MTHSERFTNTVESYQRYRPNYPDEVIEILVRYCGLNHTSVVADIGAGTGIFTRMIAAVAQSVYAIEPNQAMRTCGVSHLSHLKQVLFNDGKCTNLTLPHLI